MLEVTDEEFQKLIDAALGSLKGEHVKNIKNVAILFAEDPTEAQREKLRLLPYQSLYGLYEGTPLPFRQGQTHLYPDRITLFKNPMLRSTTTIVGLEEQIKHTLWHEIAHYYGLDHDKIHELEN
jgi:predicted Zn-dependent protease with MMP-like domain